MLSDITIGDLPSGEMTYHEMMKCMPDIENQLIKGLSAKIQAEIDRMSEGKNSVSNATA